mmetsp:Transcript_2973/g.6083  ORF Transcript_2973/g.6083 Transcript_2973/m.6083 type:complete len:85 (+) Transcript_2973:735-989(+)
MFLETVTLLEGGADREAEAVTVTDGGETVPRQTVDAPPFAPLLKGAPLTGIGIGADTTEMGGETATGTEALTEAAVLMTETVVK